MIGKSEKSQQLLLENQMLGRYWHKERFISKSWKSRGMKSRSRSTSFRARNFSDNGEYDVERRVAEKEEEGRRRRRRRRKRRKTTKHHGRMKKRLRAYYWFRELRLVSWESWSEAVVARTSSKSAANFHFNKPELSKSSTPAVSLFISFFFFLLPLLSSFYIFIALLRLLAFSMQFYININFRRYRVMQIYSVQRSMSRNRRWRNIIL